jgi:hypothetical protein
MHDIKHLEEEWKKYHWKKRRRFYLVGSMLALLVIVGYYVIYNKSVTIPNLAKTKTSLRNFDVVNTDNDLSNWIVDDTLDELTYENSVHHLVDQPTPAIDEIPILEESKKKVLVTSQPKKIKKKKIHLDIIETTSTSAYQDVANRFYQTHDPDDSLFLAKAYFKRHDYKNAEYWALQTNKVNANIEESWIIFIRSKLKLGYKNEARKILVEYIRRTGSIRAKKLLEKLFN